MNFISQINVLNKYELRILQLHIPKILDWNSFQKKKLMTFEFPAMLTHKAMYSTTLPFLGGRLRENELEYCV